MSEMTATRIGRAGWRSATLLGGAALWILAASLLWRTRVPPDVRLPHLDPRSLFSAAELRKTADYDRFGRVTFVLAVLAELATLTVLALRGPRLARGLALGRVGAGIVVGMVTVTVVWAVGLPFAIADTWWARRHGLSKGSWVEAVVGPWGRLLGSAMLALLVIAVVMGLAGRFPRGWWLAAAPIFTALAALVSLVSPYVVALSVQRPKPSLRATARALERREGIGHVPVGIQKVHDMTTQANAMALGFGPTRRVVLWDTLLDGRFTRPEIRVVLAHELGHHQRRHILKGIGWFGLFALPGSFVLAHVTRRRGGMADPGVVPFGALVLVAIQLALLPVENAISRRYEAEADWVALQTTRDPAAAQGLFARFAQTSLEQPRPPWWAFALLHNHPSVMQRIEMARAWAARSGPAAAPRGGSGSPSRSSTSTRSPASRRGAPS
jgi:STE24 endopeptidase